MSRYVDHEQVWYQPIAQGLLNLGAAYPGIHPYIGILARFGGRVTDWYFSNREERMANAGAGAAAGSPGKRPRLEDAIEADVLRGGYDGGSMYSSTRDGGSTVAAGPVDNGQNMPGNRRAVAKHKSGKPPPRVSDRFRDKTL